MSEVSKDENRLRLQVLPNSGKVEQLRKETMSEPPQPPVNANAATPASSGHLNRISPIPEVLKTIEYKLLEGKVIAALSAVYDPEIPVNIYELGLIYDIEIDPEKNVHIRMTLTAPGCPVAGTLPGEVEQRVQAISEVKSATVELVWEPQWTKEMMSEAAMLQLGMF